jgi:hypothetical protein
LRHDFVLVNTTDSADLPCAHLYDLFTCKSVDGKKHDIALVSMSKHSSWKPNTLWDGCRVYNELKESQLVFMKYFIRGAYMSPVFASGKQNVTYLADTSAYDMFLRAGN